LAEGDAKANDGEKFFSPIVPELLNRFETERNTNDI